MAQQSLSILLADDEEIVHKTIGDYLKECGHHIDHANDGKSALRLVETHEYDLALVDVRMPGIDGLELLQRVHEILPDLSVVIITAHGSLDMAIQALRAGAADFLAKPIKLLELDAVLVKSRQLTELRKDKRRLKETIRGIQTANDQRAGYVGFLGSSPDAETVRQQIREAVDANLETILITGETGTGKEVAAREIHALAFPDKSRPFIAVSCPAISSSLMESELFGHAKGSFTGAAADRAGYFELADGGTLFLDEVADLSAVAQAALLRVLETRTLRRVGGAKEIKVNIRVIAATNVTLDELVDKGKFRRDLYYRLNGYSITLSPLRERREDILPLAEFFLKNFLSTRGLPVNGFDAHAVELLIAYHYPGNARELRNIVERATVLCKNGQIRPEHLHLPAAAAERNSPQQTIPDLQDERTILLKELESAKWNRRLAAQNLSIPYSTLRFRMQKLGIK